MEYNRMNPNEKLWRMLEHYSQITYGTDVLSLSSREAEFIIKEYKKCNKLVELSKDFIANGLNWNVSRVEYHKGELEKVLAGIDNVGE